MGKGDREHNIHWWPIQKRLNCKIVTNHLFPYIAFPLEYWLLQCSPQANLMYICSMWEHGLGSDITKAFWLSYFPTSKEILYTEGL